MITSQTRQSLHRFIVAHATSEIARYAISCINNIQSSILPHLLWCDSLPCDKITGKGSVFMDKLIGHIPWIISLISVIISWKSLKSAENIAHFNAYFSCKSTAYSNFNRADLHLLYERYLTRRAIDECSLSSLCLRFAKRARCFASCLQPAATSAQFTEYRGSFPRSSGRFGRHRKIPSMASSIRIRKQNTASATPIIETTTASKCVIAHPPFTS